MELVTWFYDKYCQVLGFFSEAPRLPKDLVHLDSFLKFKTEKW